jgi:hypothetical protein
VIRAPLEAELREQAAAVENAGDSMERKVKILKAAVKRCTRDESKARAQERYDRAYATLMGLRAQRDELIDLARYGRFGWPEDPVPFNEHQEVNVDLYAWSRQQHDVNMELLAGLLREECDEPDQAAWISWTDAMLRRECKQAKLERDKARALAKAERLFKDKAKAARDRWKRRSETLERRVERLERELAEARESASDRVKTLVSEKEMYRVSWEERERDLVEAKAELRKKRQDDRSYDVLKKHNEEIIAYAQRLTFNLQEHKKEHERVVEKLRLENERLEDHIDRISGR